MISATACIVMLFGLLIYFYLLKSNKKLPPGPKGLPIIGNMLQMDKSVFKTFVSWAKKYGDIYRVKLGNSLFVVVSDYKMLKEMFTQDAAFTGRMDMGDSLELYNDGLHYGIMNNEGEHWEQLRRFTLRQLRDFGFGKNTMENLVMEELKELLDWMKSNEGVPISDVKEKMTLAVVNALWTIISGKRFAHDDPKLLNLTYQTTKALEDVAETGGLLFFAPYLKYIIPEWSGYNGVRKLMDGLASFFTETVNEHKTSYSDDHQRDFIDAFLKEIKQNNDTTSAFHGDYGARQLVTVIKDLFIAGSDTTSTTLSWTILYLSTFPETQKKLQNEIESVTKNSRHCSLADRSSMPYTEALLAEILRYSSSVPTGLAHKALADREFKGYFIPKGAVLTANVYYIHHDPKVWGDPKNFRPERFLSPDEKAFKKHDALIPFSIGRRQCLGETLARDTLFLFITNIFQRFHVKLDPNEINPGLEPAPGFMLNPKPYKVILKDRL